MIIRNEAEIVNRFQKENNPQDIKISYGLL